MSSLSSAPEVDAGSPTHTVRVTKEAVLAGRRKYFPKCSPLSHSQVSPFVALRGEKEKLFDENGVEYLDTRNNVAILGHSDPRVAEAVYRQLNLINTNTRYLHPNQVEIARLLSSILPKQLCKFFMVNSGSEATDLALRLARYHTGANHTIALSQAYHGCTQAAMDVSDWKYRDPHCVKPDWVTIVNSPNLHSGVHTTVEAYTEEVRQVCEKRFEEISSIIVESVVSVGGGVILPPSYLATVFGLVRQAGGVCISDETQVGLGRLGTWWGFELDGAIEAIPDIVIIGKQLGNGFPVACVATTVDICDSFDRAGIEFFSTYGGSTAACAAGIATLHAIKEDRLLEKARSTGRFLLERLGVELRQFIPSRIREIRGRGLYIAIEFVEGAVAGQVHNELYRDYRILSTLDGLDANVMIVKPPLCISESSCETFVDAVRDILAKK